MPLKEGYSVISCIMFICIIIIMTSLVHEECAIFLVLKNNNIIIINYSNDDNNNNQYQPGANIFLWWIFLAIAFTALTKREVQAGSSIMLTSCYQPGTVALCWWTCQPGADIAKSILPRLFNIPCTSKWKWASVRG